MLVMDKVKIVFVLCFCFFFWCLVERIDTFPYLDYILLPTSIFVFLFLFFFPIPTILFNCFGNKQYTGTLQTHIYTTQKETTNLLDYQKEFHCMEKGWDVGATSPLVSIELQGGSLIRLRTEPYVVSFFISFC